MTIKEMEPLIDGLNLKKIEVKMRRGGQVVYFVCVDGESLDEDGVGNIFVFDSEGRAWLACGVKCEVDKVWNVASNGRVAFLNGKQMERYGGLDLPLAREQ